MRRSGKAGFTLIELVVVIAVIAAIAGFLIPQVAMIGRSADMAASARGQADVANNIQLYFVQQKSYPSDLDSLLYDADGDTGTAPDGLYGPFDSTGAMGAACDGNDQVGGLPKSGPDLWKQLELHDIGPNSSSGYATETYLRSLSRSGFDYVLDHDMNTVNASNSARYQRAVPNGKTDGQSFPVARVIAGSDVQKALVPRGLPAGTMLVALGFGPKNSALGKTAMQSPIYPGCDGKYYGRYVAIFMIYESGKRATLVGVVDSYGRYPDYTIQQYNESLPDGARRG